MYKQRSAQSGFSMVELLVAIVILAIALLGLAELQVSAIKTNAQSDSISVADALGQKVVEEIAAMSAEDALFETSTASPQTWSGSPFTIDGAGVYNVTYEVAADYETVDGLSRITIYVASADAISSVLGKRVRSMQAVTFKRSF